MLYYEGTIQSKEYPFGAASIKREMTFTAFQQEDVKSGLNQKLSDQHFFLLGMKEEDSRTADTKKPGRVHEHEKESTRSVCLLEQKRKVVSSNIDVPPARPPAKHPCRRQRRAAQRLPRCCRSHPDQHLLPQCGQPGQRFCGRGPALPSSLWPAPRTVLCSLAGTSASTRLNLGLHNRHNWSSGLEGGTQSP
ncbi:UNVERIFIED_CONTAM: hypothetical protein K2H54_037818 [Gekko kuhli]